MNVSNNTWDLNGLPLSAPPERMTKLEIINETIEYYSQDPDKLRSMNSEQGCVYFNAYDDTMCAVGRCLDRQPDWKEFTHYEEKCSAMQLIERYNPPFKAKYTGHEAKFWHDLQELHDQDEYWASGEDYCGLSAEGYDYADLIRTAWQDK